MKYDIVYSIFKENGCELLSSKEEVEKLKTVCSKLRYIAKCKHEHIVFFNVFKYNGTGILCPKCKIAENAHKSKEKLNIDKLQYIMLEKQCIDYFIDFVKDQFNCIKAYDGCKSDIILKPLNVINDEWIGIQVKSTLCKNKYEFHLDKDYTNLLMLFICWEDKSMWLIPYNDISTLKKITIGSKRSKYSNYSITNENWKDTILNYYHNNEKTKYETLDTPIGLYTQREKKYRNFRHTKIDFLEFSYDNIEGTVYDFKINGFKVQEKVGSIKNKHSYYFNLCKNDGKDINKKRKQTSYKKNDNDFYWLNCPDMRYFYIIPENIMIDNNIVNVDKKKTIYLSPKNTNMWYSEYLFDYENLNKDCIYKMFYN